MKYSLTLGARGPMTREKAWVCFTMNLAVPGTGSLLAGKVSGYLQFLLGAAGMVITMACGAKFMAWFFANWSRLQEGNGDPMQNLSDMWMAVRWPLLGIVLFGVGWLWGMFTGMILVAKAPKSKPPSASPPPVPN
jgi:hypothetical protein